DARHGGGEQAGNDQAGNDRRQVEGDVVRENLVGILLEVESLAEAFGEGLEVAEQGEADAGEGEADEDADAELDSEVAAGGADVFRGHEALHGNLVAAHGGHHPEEHRKDGADDRDPLRPIPTEDDLPIPVAAPLGRKPGETAHFYGHRAD